LELREFKRILRQVMVLPVLALLLLAGALSWQIYAAAKTVTQIEVQDERIARTNRIQRLTVDEETGLRGYEITRDPRFLEPYRAAQVPLRQAVDEQFANLTGPGPNIKAFVAEHQAWREHFAEPLIAVVAAGGEAGDIDLNLTGKALMDSMRGHMEAIVKTAEQRRDDDILKWRTQVGAVVLGLIVLAIAVGLFIGLFTRDRLEAVSNAFRRSLYLERTRTEELFQSEQHLRTTLASIGDGVITCGADGRIHMMNTVAQELTGWLEADASNRPLEEVFHIVHETTREKAENPVEKVKHLNRVVSLSNHIVLIRKDGEELAIDDSGAPIRNPDGELTGVVMVFRDVTQERKTRAALLASEKLAVAGRLAATIAHEIHNPLDSVSNLLYLLQTGSTPEESRQFLHTAQSELARVTQISRAMLSLYRESKAPVQIHLKETLEDLLLLMDRRFHELRVSITAELPAEVIVDGFPGELRQVFTNLISNAAEAAGPGGSVTVRVFPRPAGPDPSDPVRKKLEPGAIVEIIDNGPGIPTQVREHLFQPFFTTKGERGTGLGLWVSQGIIRKHAGALTLNSETSGPNHGTVASVFLAAKPVIDPGGD
jgi:PAS domain S-box-containing protein